VRASLSQESGGGLLNRTRIGIALGSGAARGWAHIGILQELKAMNIEPDVVCGSSIGALVGGSSVAGRLNELEDWLVTLDRLDVVKFFDLSLIKGGLIAGKRIIEFFRERFGDFDIESLAKPYGAVATDLMSGEEVWLCSGSLLDAVRASISIPGIFEPFFMDGRWFIDGGVVNPVPVSLCRALGADRVIAVDVNGCIAEELSCTEPGGQQGDRDRGSAQDREALLQYSTSIADSPGLQVSLEEKEGRKKPGLFHVIHNSIYFMQKTITQTRLAFEPPEIVLSPDICDIGFMDFHEAEKVIADGRNCVRKNESRLADLLQN
jgi:NTE family protein